MRLLQKVVLQASVAGLALGLVDAETFDRLVRPETMV